MAISKQRDLLLVVGDEAPILGQLITRLHAEGYQGLIGANGVQTREIIDSHDVALVLLDITHPGKSSPRIVREIKDVSPDTAVIAVADTKDAAGAIECVRNGAYDFVTKPLNLDLVVFAVRRALETRKLALEVRDNRQLMERTVTERTRDLAQTLAKAKSASIDTIIRLSRAAEYKDTDTGSHIERMSRYTAFVAERMGLPDAYCETMMYAASMHDIGKIGIPDSILLKPGKLTDAEWDIMKQHTIIGARILDGAEAEAVKLGASIAISHHEKWNGTGYPLGLKGENIPLSGRIAAIADVFDSLTSKRAYRKDDFSPNETFKVIEQSVGVQFDPAVFAAFKAAWPDIVAEQERFHRLDACRRQEISERQAAELSA
jgi:putative two-component system response regulator